MRKKAPKIELKSWSAIAAQGLTNSREAAHYLEEAFNDGPQIFLVALGRVVSARGGIKKLAKKSGLTEKSLSKLLSGDSKALLSSVVAVLSALEIRVHFPFKSSKRKSLSDSLVTSAKDLNLSKATINKLEKLNNRTANFRRTKVKIKAPSNKKL